MTEQPPRNTEEKVNHQFMYHNARNKGITMAHAEVIAIANKAANSILDYVAEGPELEEGLKKLREAMMWFNAGIAVNSSDNSSTDGKLVVDEP